MIWQTDVLIAVTFSVFLATGCAGSKHPLVEDLTSHQDLSLYRLQSVRGTRDGDRLAVQAVISDSSSILTMEMHFAVGSPTRLESGTWHWASSGRQLAGRMTSRSVTFLGGQDGPPSIGGSFDLTADAPGQDMYRVTIPLTVLRERWNG